MSLIFGILTLVKAKKEPARFYKKKGGLGFFAIFETIILIFFLAHFLPFIIEGAALTDGFILITLSAISFIIVLFRYIGFGLFRSGRKSFNTK